MNDNLEILDSENTLELLNLENDNLDLNSEIVYNVTDILNAINKE